MALPLFVLSTVQPFSKLNRRGDRFVKDLDKLHTELLFSSSGRDVLVTIIAGREVYRDGRVVGFDEDRLRARMNEIAQKL